MNPPECKREKTQSFSGDNPHAYMLGKNLYQYITASQPNVFYKCGNRERRDVRTDASELDFSSSVFETEAVWISKSSLRRHLNAKLILFTILKGYKNRPLIDMDNTLPLPAILPLWPITADTDGLSRYQADAVHRFVELVNATIPKLNQLIETYNGLTEEAQKLSVLKELEREFANMQSRVPPDAVSRSNDYIFHIQQVLSHEIYQEFKALGQVVNQPETLSEIIAAMPPAKVSQFAEILASGQFEKDVLYKPGEVGKEAFDAFCARHTIAPMAGVNSKNFKVINKETRKAEVLKLDNRMGASTHLEKKVRASAAQGVLSSISADRQVTYQTMVKGKPTPVTRRLVATEFYDGGDLTKHAEQYPSDEERLEKALDIYIQMAEILQKMEAEGVAFPDMKNTNWLIDESGRLRIADTKTFFPIRSDGTLDNSEGIPNSTHYIEPPEICFLKVSATKMHSYMYAKNLYQYLTQCSNDYFLVNPSHPMSDAKDVSELDFSAPIFRTERGRELEPLIKGMMQGRPAKERPSIEEAHERLSQLRNAPVIQNFNDFKATAQQQTQELRGDKNKPPKDENIPDDTPGAKM